MDRVLGIMHVKDLVGLPKKGNLRSILRPPRYAPETAHISWLWGHFQSTRQHRALVIDEHGMLPGIMKLENVMEKIVGPGRHFSQRDGGLPNSSPHPLAIGGLKDHGAGAKQVPG